MAESIVSASHQYESALINSPVERVWGLVKVLAFEQLFPRWVTAVEWVSGGPGQVGGEARVTFQDGAIWTFNILEISDYRRRVVYDLISAEPETSMSACTNIITVHKETLNNRCFVVWETEFSNDATANVIADNKYKKIDGFNSMNEALSSN